MKLSRTRKAGLFIFALTLMLACNVSLPARQVSPQSTASLAPGSTLLAADSATETPPPLTPTVAPASVPVPRQLTTAQLSSLIPHRWGKGSPQAAAYSTDGSKLAVATALGVHVYSASGSNMLWNRDTPASPQRLRFSSDSQRLVASTFGQVWVWQAADGTLLTDFHPYPSPEDYVEILGISPDASVVGLRHNSGNIEVWNINQNRILQQYSFENPLRVAFDPGNLFMAVLEGSFHSGASTSLNYAFCILNQQNPLGGEVVTALSDDPASLAFGNGPDLFAMGDVNGWVTVFRSVNNRWQREYQFQAAQDRPVDAVVFSKDENLLAAATWDSIKVWDLITGKERITLPEQGAQSLDFSADGKTLAVVHWQMFGQVNFYNTVSGELQSSLEFSPLINNPAFSVDGKTAAVAQGWENITLFAMPSRQSYPPLFVPISRFRGEQHFAMGNAWLATLSDLENSAETWLWKFDSIQPVERLQTGAATTLLSFSADGNTLAVANVGVQLYSMSGFTLLKRFDVFDTDIYALALSPDASLVAVGSARTGEVIVLRTQDSAQVFRYKPPCERDQCYFRVEGVGFSPGNTYLFATINGELNHTWGYHTLQFRLSDGQQLLDYPGNVFALSPDGNYLAIADSTTLHIYTIGENQPFASYTVHNAAITGLAFSPDGGWLLSTSDDGTAIFWEVPE